MDIKIFVETDKAAGITWWKPGFKNKTMFFVYTMAGRQDRV